MQTMTEADKAAIIAMDASTYSKYLWARTLVDAAAAGMELPGEAVEAAVAAIRTNRAEEPYPVPKSGYEDALRRRGQVPAAPPPKDSGYPKPRSGYDHAIEKARKEGRL